MKTLDGRVLAARSSRAILSRVASRINNALITDIIDYIFHPKGTFDSNNKVNWDFNTTTSTLTIFASDSALPTETLVTETVMPWLERYR